MWLTGPKLGEASRAYALILVLLARRGCGDGLFRADAGDMDIGEEEPWQFLGQLPLRAGAGDTAITR